MDWNEASLKDKIIAVVVIVLAALILFGLFYYEASTTPSYEQQDPDAEPWDDYRGR